MRLTPLRLLVLALPLAALTGCASRGASCSSDTDYLQAAERPPLQLPAGITPTERIQPLQIPPVDPVPDKLDPVPPCLDQPPSYFARKASTVESSALDAVRAWAVAWAARQPDAVMEAYSASFQSPGVGGAETFLSLVRQQVEHGVSPEPQLEDLASSTLSSDRRLVTFTQRFGDEAVRKELTMAREGDAWRIVAERTL